MTAMPIGGFRGRNLSRPRAVSDAMYGTQATRSTFAEARSRWEGLTFDPDDVVPVPSA
jgi:hypothetical protein